MVARSSAILEGRRRKIATGEYLSGIHDAASEDIATVRAAIAAAWTGGIPSAGTLTLLSPIATPIASRDYGSEMGVISRLAFPPAGLS